MTAPKRARVRRTVHTVRPRLRHNFFLDAYDPVSGAHLRRLVEEHNLFVDSGLGTLRDFLYGDPVTGLTHFALGDGPAPVAPGSTDLDGEKYRDVFTQKTKSGPKQLTVKTHLTSTMGNGNTYTHAGLFGNGATATLGSGTLFAALGFSPQPKTTAEAWTFTWVIDVLDDGL